MGKQETDETYHSDYIMKHSVIIGRAHFRNWLHEGIQLLIEQHSLVHRISNEFLEQTRVI